MPRLVEERGHLGGHQRRPCAREVAENVEKARSNCLPPGLSRRHPRDGRQPRLTARHTKLGVPAGEPPRCIAVVCMQQQGQQFSAKSFGGSADDHGERASAESVRQDIARTRCA